MGSFQDEATAWAAALSGDSDGFGAVFDHNLQRVYGHALRLTTSRHDAEDLTAGAFFELWRCRRHVRVVDGSVLAWLLVTITNLDRNRVRGLRRYRAMLSSLPRNTVAPSAADIAVERVTADATFEQVRAALRRLKPADATLIALTGYEGFTPAGAAEALGISPGAARIRLHRARARLNAELGDGQFANLAPTSLEQPR